MSELPSGWARTTLGTVADWGAGGTPSRSEPNFYGGKIPWIKSGELNSRYIKTTEESITEEAIKSSSAKIFPAGSVAIAMYGATIGKTAILGIDASTNQACAVGVPVEGLIGKGYLYRLLQNEKAAFIEKGKGGAQPNISQAVIKAHEIGLPPLAEQTRIAAKLDELLAQVDTLKARIDGIPALLKRFRQSVLAAAVSGRLTKNIEGSDLPPEWLLVNFSTVVSDLRYGTAQKCDYNGGETGVLRIPNIGDNGIRLNDLKSSNFSPAEIRKLSLKKGDILLIRSNGSVDLVGKSAVVGSREEGLLFAGYLIRVRPNAEKAIDKYINYWLKSPAVRQVIEMTARSTSGVNNINSEEIKSLIFTMPPLSEQNEIVSRVEQLFALADQLEAKVASAQNCIDRLTQSILAKAFRGELAPQDPNDEPASMLLERIKAQRATAPKARRGRQAAQ
ncbi:MULTISPECIES: restriction endonuclease subunit S [Pseudomonas]|uniref:restriction endonuclease subunit S n=1 Tax=Pseudomonas TaxID=286 RepID=UPI000F3D3151|nr:MULTISPECIES: restriction endonuclease subunit S [Pseudomonas]MCH5651576.1 restriction endonuclease subunit S [Pseudomonas syringae]RMS63544.1 Specificity determinant for hsdM and hsdR [Pseudomonas syringae pv. aceris]